MMLRRFRLGAVASAALAVLLHCRWVLLNGASVPYRLWTVLRTLGTARFIAILSRFGRRVTRPRALTRWLYVAVGAFPPFLWTFLFKQAKHIPTEIRPPVSRTFVFTFVPLFPRAGHHLHLSWELGRSRTAPD